MKKNKIEKMLIAGIGTATAGLIGLIGVLIRK